jgi:hypothetical protein
MKTPTQLWNEHRTSTYGQEPLQPSHEAQLRHAFIRGLESALEVLKRLPDLETITWFQEQIEQLKGLPPHVQDNVLDIDSMIQQFRTLRLSQLRQQLAHDDKHNIDRLINVYHFLKLAKERI